MPNSRFSQALEDLKNTLSFSLNSGVSLTIPLSLYSCKKDVFWPTHWFFSNVLKYTGESTILEILLSGIYVIVADVVGRAPARSLRYVGRSIGVPTRPLSGVKQSTTSHALGPDVLFFLCSAIWI